MSKKNKIIFSICILIVILFSIKEFNRMNKKINNLESSIISLSNKIESMGFEIYELQSNNSSNNNNNNNSNNLTNSNTTEETIFDNPIVDSNTNLISQDDAQKIWNDYRIMELKIDSGDFKITKVENIDVKPNNYIDPNRKEGYKVADFKRKAFVFYCEYDGGLEQVVGYVDMYTGKVIGGYYKGI